MPPASKVSRRLAERIAPELVEHIYRARLAGELIASFPLLSALNEAHLVMLARCGIETPDVGGALAVTLLRVAEEGPAPFGIGRPAARYTLLIDAAATLRRAMPDRAELFAMVVMPGHTRLQPAQPITFGYYLLEHRFHPGTRRSPGHHGVPHRPCPGRAVAGLRWCAGTWAGLRRLLRRPRSLLSRCRASLKTCISS